MVNSIPLIGEQPAYPQVSLNLIPQGMSITIALGPTTAINQLIDASTMDDVVKTWRETRRNAADLLRTVQSTKL